MRTLIILLFHFFTTQGKALHSSLKKWSAGQILLSATSAQLHSVTLSLSCTHPQEDSLLPGI